MESKLIIPALALSLLSFTAFATGTHSDSTDNVNKLTQPSFESMDSNGDGMMSKDEFGAAMGKMNASSMSNDGMSTDSMGKGAMSKDSPTESIPAQDDITPAPGDAMGK